MKIPNSYQIETRSLDELTPYERNPKKHSDAQIAAIVNSIREFGFTAPVLVDADNRIIAGEARWKAARVAGMSTVPVIALGHLNPDQVRAYRIADNKLAEKGEWSIDDLKNELLYLKDTFDLSLLGFDPDELEKLLAVQEPEGLTDEDATPEVPEVPVSKPGDIWLCGPHRVVCGDSTNLADVERMMDGELADMVFTDPPYNVAYESQGKKNKLGKIKNDDMSDETFEQFLRDVFASYSAIMKPLAIIYVCHPDSQSAPKLAFEKTFAEQFKKSSTIIWAKQAAGMGWQDFRVQHEPILYGWKEGKGKHFFCGDRAKTTIWNIGRDAQASYVHPTQKPVALVEEAIANSSKGSDIVVDLFGGSGSTLIACQKSGRVCRTMELDAKYVDVIVKRWCEFTGLKAKLESDGTEFPMEANKSDAG